MADYGLGIRMVPMEPAADGYGDDEDDDEEEERTHYDGRKATVDGRTFDVPSWIATDAFVAGLHGDDKTNPLSSLTALEHIEGSDDTGGDGYGGEAYHARFLVPYGGSRTLCFPDESFSRRDEDSDIDVDMTPEGMEVKLDVARCRDVSMVLAYCQPDDDAGFAAMATDSDDMEIDSGYTADDLREMLADEGAGWLHPGDFIRRVDVPGRGRYVIAIMTDED